MDILKYMGSLEIIGANKEVISRFLTNNEFKIKENILSLWNSFISIDNVNAGEIPIELPELIDLENSQDLTCKNNDMIPKTEENTSVAINNIISVNAGNDVSFKKVEQNDSNNETEKNNTLKYMHTSNSDVETLIKNKNIVLPNGKVNQDYNYSFIIDVLGLSGIADFWFEGLEKIGLKFDPETKQIVGIPSISGEHKIKLCIKRNDWDASKPIFERLMTLFINPDPKSLWKNIPTLLDVEYYKPDSDKNFVKADLSIGNTHNKDIVAASQRGRSHAQEGKPRDDDFNIKFLNEVDWYILSVADGAGSAKASRKGSEIACNTVVEICEQIIKEKTIEFENLIKDFSIEKTDERRKKLGDSLYGILGNAVFKALKNIEEEAKNANKPIKDYSTTLIVSICKKFNFGWFVGAFWVGDGGIGIYNKETQFLKILGESDGGEYAGQTRFLTMPEITQPAELYRRLRFDIVDDFTALILMTDGITDPKFETDANLMKVEKWNELWMDLSKEVDFSDNNEAAADQLLNWLDFWSPGNHDDRTIAILF